MKNSKKTNSKKTNSKGLLFSKFKKNEITKKKQNLVKGGTGTVIIETVDY